MRKPIHFAALLAIVAATSTPGTAVARDQLRPAGADRGAVDAAVPSADAADRIFPRQPGLYLLADAPVAPRMIRIEPVTASRTKAGGAFGFALSGGVAPMKMKSVVPGGTAPTRSTTPKPVFLFYLATTDAASPGAAPAVEAETPAAFSLIRFDAKKSRREADVGSYSMYAGLKTGVTDKDRIAFDTDQVGPGVFKVTPRAALAPGEYGFVYSVTAADERSSGKGINMTVQVFDFAVASSRGR